MNKPLTALAVAAAVLACACGSGGDSKSVTAPSPTTTKFQGTFAGNGDQSGTLDVTIQAVVSSQFSWLDRMIPVLQAQSTSGVSGTITTVGGLATSVAGTYNSGTGGVQLSAGSFTFTGGVSGGKLAGTFTGPNGSTGVFSSLNATSNLVTVYCGTYSAQGGLETGNWNVQISTTGAATGVASGNVPPAVTLNGQLSGSTLTLTSSEGKTATGKVNGSTVSGTSDNGTIFAGGTDSCNAQLSASPGLPTPTVPTTRSYVGEFSGQHTLLTISTLPGGTTCAATYSITGTATVTLPKSGGGGTFVMDVPGILISASGTSNCGRDSTTNFGLSGSATSSGGSVTFSASNGSGITENVSFSGTLAGNVISGTLVLSESGSVGNNSTHGGSSSFSLTLR